MASSSVAAPLPPPLAAPYREAARSILDAARADGGAYTKLAHLTDRIGHRLSGSAALDRAIFWASSAMLVDGLDNVHTEAVTVPRWVRGEAWAELLSPAAHRLHVLALGGSPATPRGGLTAPVLVVSDFAELEARAAEVKGKIVLFNKALPPYGPAGSGYGEVVAYRGDGPRRASLLGAVAALVRSVTATSLRTPHTGATSFQGRPTHPAQPARPIPAVAVSVEDAELLARLARGPEPLVLRLYSSAETLPDVESANVVGELRGRERPEEVVLLAAHLDSWDVGQGAHDDGAGCVMAMQAVALLRRLGLVARRTIRVVLYTNEENGLRGGLAYAEAHRSALDRHVAAIEADSGGFRALGFRAEGSPRAREQVRALSSLLAPIGADRVSEGWAGADISVLKPAGVELLGLEVEGRRYFDLHHSEADTLDKVDDGELRTGVAALAVLAYTLADLPIRLGSAPP